MLNNYLDVLAEYDSFVHDFAIEYRQSGQYEVYTNLFATLVKDDSTVVSRTTVNFTLSYMEYAIGDEEFYQVDP